LVGTDDVSAEHVSDVKNYFGWNCKAKLGEGDELWRGPVSQADTLSVGVETCV